jgi:hypothetical protein
LEKAAARTPNHNPLIVTDICQTYAGTAARNFRERLTTKR